MKIYPITDPAFSPYGRIVSGRDTAKTEIKNDGDDALLWACNKWLLAHPDSAEAKAGAYVGLTGENIKI